MFIIDLFAGCNCFATGYNIYFSKCFIYFLFYLSPDELLSMQEFAKSKGMEVIPLVQTFGHMEVKRNLRFPLNPYFFHLQLI